MSLKKYEAVGRCIYCGLDGKKERLSNEHIVPYAFGGKLIVPKASCKRCAAITSAFELDCARDMYGITRAKLNFPTRHKGKRPTEMVVQSTGWNGQVDYVALPISSIVAVTPILHFLPPGYLRKPAQKEIGWGGSLVAIHPLPVDSSQLMPKTKYTLNLKFNVDSFAKMLAKIAHAYIVAELGFDKFEHWLPQYILGKEPALSYFIGGLPPTFEPLFQPGEIPRLAWRLQQVNDEWLVLVQIELFGSFSNSPIIVITGKLKEDYIHEHLIQ